jgi:nucleotide-binding universal stress UspA family protein
MAKTSGKRVPRGLERILWSVEAFEPADETLATVIEVFRALERRKPLKLVEAAYVLSPDQLDLPMEFTEPWVKQYRPAAELALEQKLKDFVLGTPIQPRVLVQKSPSFARSVAALAKHAKNARMDLIVVGTHGREGLSRILMGSFAESLVMEARVPVLTVKPIAGGTLDFGTIVFSTDFSAKSLLAFRKLLAQAAVLGSRVLVLHSIPNPVQPVVQSGILLGGGWVSVPKYLDKLQAKQRGVGEKWVRLAMRQGVEAELILDTGTHGVVESVLVAARERGAGMIAMSAQSGKVAAEILGSVTRKVVRQAECPVWVFKT